MKRELQAIEKVIEEEYSNNLWVKSQKLNRKDNR